jgi:hypothetical protein
VAAPSSQNSRARQRLSFKSTHFTAGARLADRLCMLIETEINVPRLMDGVRRLLLKDRFAAQPDETSERRSSEERS